MSGLVREIREAESPWRAGFWFVVRFMWVWGVVAVVVVGGWWLYNSGDEEGEGVTCDRQSWLDAGFTEADYNEWREQSEPGRSDVGGPAMSGCE